MAKKEDHQISNVLCSEAELNELRASTVKHDLALSRPLHKCAINSFRMFVKYMTLKLLVFYLSVGNYSFTSINIYRPREWVGKGFTHVCLSVNLCFQVITFEEIDLLTLHLVC